jgi:hypothetical protein
MSTAVDEIELAIPHVLTARIRAAVAATSGALKEVPETTA